MNEAGQHHSSIFLNLLEHVIRRRLLAVLLITLITLVCAAGIFRLQIDTGFDSLIPESAESRLIYKRVSAEFGTDNKTLIYISDKSLWTHDKLLRFTRLHHALETLPGVTHVESLANLRTVRGSAGSVKTIRLLADVPSENEEILTVREEALYDPLINGFFISGDGNALTMLVSVSDEISADDSFSKKIDARLQPYAGDFEHLFQVGSLRINSELKQSLLDDLLLLGPLSVLILVVVLLVLIRSVTAAMIPLMTSVLSLIWALGFMGWFNIPMNILTAMLPSLIVVIASTEDTHMVLSYLQGVGQDKQASRERAVRYMIRQIAVPVMLTILTTALGFASNVFNSIGLIRDFAIASTVAIAANGIITVVLVPLVLNSFGPLKSLYATAQNGSKGITGWIYTLFDKGNRRHSKSILLLTTLLCLFFVYQAANLFVTNDPLSYFREDRQLIRDIDRVHTQLSGMKSFFITLESDQDKAFQYPENINKLVEIQQFLKKQGIFDSSISFADHLSLINQEFNDGNNNAYRLPHSREQVAQYLLFFHRNDLDSYVSHDFQRANIIVWHHVTDSKTLNQHVTELELVVSSIAGENMRGYVTGENLMINRSAESLLKAQVHSLMILLLVIFLLISLMFTSFKGGFIALIPTLIPIILMFGIMGLFDISLNPGTVMVAVISIGIAVDGTIHLFSRYNDLCRKIGDNEEAVRQTVEAEAMPIVATSLALAVGFGVLLFSNFTVIAQFGALSALTMLLSVYANLLITPIIMSRVRLIGLYEILVMRMKKDMLKKSPLFKNMSDYQIRKSILISEYIDVADGKKIIEEGTYGRNMYLLLSGGAVVIHQGEEIKKLEVGDVFGEIGFVRETLRTADVVARGPVQLLKFDYQRLQKDLKYFPHIVAKMNFNISCILGERLAEVIEQTRGIHRPDTHETDVTATDRGAH